MIANCPLRRASVFLFFRPKINHALEDLHRNRVEKAKRPKLTSDIYAKTARRR